MSKRKGGHLSSCPILSFALACARACVHERVRVCMRESECVHERVCERESEKVSE